jgi:hypothetical protein
MEEPDSTRRAGVLAQVIGERRSVRGFTEDVPPREAIGQVIAAVLTAPYPAAPGSRSAPRTATLPPTGPGLPADTHR